MPTTPTPTISLAPTPTLPPDQIAVASWHVWTPEPSSIYDVAAIDEGPQPPPLPSCIWVYPQKESTEGCVTKAEDDLNNCDNPDAFDTINIAYTTFTLGSEYSFLTGNKALCGQLSSYSGSRSDEDYFFLNLPFLNNRMGWNVQLRLKLTGDSFDANIRFAKIATSGTCGQVYPAVIQGTIASGVYDVTATNLDAGDYRIEVKATNLTRRSPSGGIEVINTIECGSGTYSYYLQAIPNQCFKSGYHCGQRELTWGVDDTGCFAGRLSFDWDTRIGTWVSLPIAFIACLVA